MIDIRIDGESLDIGSELSIPVNLTNPHLSYESIPSSSANIPSVPFSLRNQRIFEYAEMPQAGGDFYDYDCEMIYNGALAYHGKAYVKSANPASGYQLQVGDDLGRFFGSYHSVLLSELEFGTISSGVSHELIEVFGTSAICFPLLKNPDYYSTNGDSIDYNGLVNDTHASSPTVPMIFVKYLLGKITELTGVKIEGDFFNHPTWSKLILTNWRALDGESSIHINRHLPDWTIGTFLLELRKIANLQLIFDAIQKRITIDFWDPKLSIAPTVDFTPYAVPGHDKYPELNRRLHLTFDLDGGDSLLKDRPEPMADYISAAGLESDGIVKVNFKLSTFLVDEATGLPIARQTGVTNQFGQLSVGSSPRLLFYHGIVNNKVMALPELGGISLYLTDQNGIAAYSWSNVEKMRQEMFYLKKDFILNETFLARIDFSTPIHYNGLNYIIANVSGELPIKKPFSLLLIKI